MVCIGKIATHCDNMKAVQIIFDFCAKRPRLERKDVCCDPKGRALTACAAQCHRELLSKRAAPTQSMAAGEKWAAYVVLGASVLLGTFGGTDGALVQKDVWAEKWCELNDCFGYNAAEQQKQAVRNAFRLCACARWHHPYPGMTSRHVHAGGQGGARAPQDRAAVCRDGRGEGNPRREYQIRILWLRWPDTRSSCFPRRGRRGKRKQVSPLPVKPHAS